MRAFVIVVLVALIALAGGCSDPANTPSPDPHRPAPATVLGPRAVPRPPTVPTVPGSIRIVQPAPAPTGQGRSPVLQPLPTPTVQGRSPVLQPSSAPTVRGQSAIPQCWNAVPSPNGSATTNELQAVAGAAANDVWAAGFLSNAPIDGWTGALTSAQTLLLHWDGARWALVPSPNPGPTVSVLRGLVALAPNNVWAVGAYGDATGRDRPLVLHWDGARWTALHSGDLPTTEGQLAAITATGPNDLWAVGSSQGQALLLHWDGRRWTRRPAPFTGAPHAALLGVSAAARDDVWAVGYRAATPDTNAMDNNLPLILHWDGTAWRLGAMPPLYTGRGHNALLGVAAPGRGTAWAVETTEGESGGATAVLRWDGARWTATDAPGRHLPDPNDLGDRSLAAVAAPAPDDAWIAGWRTILFQDGLFAQGKTLLIHWDGQAWHTVPSPNPGIGDNGLTAVAAVAPGALWAVGHGGFVNEHTTLILRYTPSCAPPRP